MLRNTACRTSVAKPRSGRGPEFPIRGLRLHYPEVWTRQGAAAGDAMVRVEIAKWGQSLEDLRRASLGAAHPRTRERFQALYLIASGQFNATSCALHVGRHDETVLGWVHRYNAH